MHYRIIIAFVGVFLSLKGFSQSEPISRDAKQHQIHYIGKPDTSFGGINIYADERLQPLVKKYARLSKEGVIPIEGYRVQIASASGNNAKSRVNQVKAQFLMSYIEVPAYLGWDSPNYKIRVGDFRTALDAEKFQVQIKEQFPYAFVVSDDINFPPLDEQEEEE